MPANYLPFLIVLAAPAAAQTGSTAPRPAIPAASATPTAQATPTSPGATGTAAQTQRPAQTAPAAPGAQPAAGAQAATGVQAATGAQANTAAAPTVPNPKVGGAQMLSNRTIVDNAAAAPNLSTLVAAIRAADLATTLSGPGPFTVFAPTNEAFGRLAPGTVDTLMKPENKASLVKVLNYHIVPGAITLADLRQRTAAGNGTATLTTVEGEPLTVTITQNVVTLSDVNGNKSYLQIPDVRQSNGVVHVVNGVVIPKLG